MPQQAAEVTLQAIFLHLIARKIAISGESSAIRCRRRRLHLRAHRLAGTAHQVLHVVFRQLDKLGQRGGRTSQPAQSRDPS